jgi:hypothetical protein
MIVANKAVRVRWRGVVREGRKGKGRGMVRELGQCTRTL